MTKVLDPTNETTPAEIPRVDRPESLEGLTVGLLDISKPRGDRFLDRIEERLVERGLRVERFRKPTFTKPAPVDLRHAVCMTSPTWNDEAFQAYSSPPLSSLMVQRCKVKHWALIQLQSGLSIQFRTVLTTRW